MGRATFGVKGIDLGEGDYVVGMVVAHPEMDLLTACENGFGKRTPFGPPEIADEDDNGRISRLPTDMRKGRWPDDGDRLRPAWRHAQTPCH